MSANVRHSSESNSHYTPRVFTDAARDVMGAIDLDPASSEEANRAVGAKSIWTAKDNGYPTAWAGRVWLNPPGGKCDVDGVTVTSASYEIAGKTIKRWICGSGCNHPHTGVQSSQKAWWFKLAREFESRRVTQAVFLSFSIEILQTTQVDSSGATPHDFSICFPSRRIAYVKPGGEVGGSPPHSSALIYLGPNTVRFAEVFGRFGRVMRGAR